MNHWPELNGQTKPAITDKITSGNVSLAMPSECVTSCGRSNMMIECKELVEDGWFRASDAPGLTPAAVLDKFATVQLIDVRIPTPDVRWGAPAARILGGFPGRPGNQAP